MADRQEVEALLAETELGLTPYPDKNTLAALCRAWLALDEAPVGVVDIVTGWVDGTGAVEVYYENGRPSDVEVKQQVRIVKEAL